MFCQYIFSILSCSDLDVSTVGWLVVDCAYCDSSASVAVDLSPRVGRPRTQALFVSHVESRELVFEL